MVEFAGTRGFQDAWRNQRPCAVDSASELATFKPPRPTMHAQRISAAEKARLARVVRKAPEVMVRVGRASSKTRDGAVRPTTSGGEAIRFGNRLTYVTRHDKIEVETSDGGIIATAGDRHDLAREWIEDQADYRDAGMASQRTRLYRSIILSMPPGTDPVSMQDAARAFAQEAFAGHKWIMALHTDTAHPHVHLDVQTVRDDGHKLSPGKADIERYRDGFAGHLRTLGIEAEATPRHARGSPQRASNPELYRARDRQEHPEKYRWPGRGETPTTDVAMRERVAADPAGALADRPGDLAARDRRAGVVETYLAAADELRRGSTEDRVLANEVTAFVAGMPAYGPRLHLAAQMALEGGIDLSVRQIAGEAMQPAKQPAQAVGEPSEAQPGRPDIREPNAQLFAAVYAKPQEAAERWAALVDELGADHAFDRLRTVPETLGGFQGWRVLGIENVGRREAAERFGDLVTGLRAELDARPDQARSEPEAAVPAPVAMLPPPEDRAALQAELAALLAERDRLGELQREAARQMVENAPEDRQPLASQPDRAALEPESKLTLQVRRDRPKEPEIDR